MSTATTPPAHRRTGAAEHGAALRRRSARPAAAPKQPWLPRTRTQRHQFGWGLFFTAPALIGLVVFTGGPIISSAVNSFTTANLLGGTRRFIGWENYAKLMHDAQWWQSLGNTAYLTLLSVPAGILVALGLALLLN